MQKPGQALWPGERADAAKLAQGLTRPVFEGQAPKNGGRCVGVRRLLSRCSKTCDY
jgi:hypothetical protein